MNDSLDVFSDEAIQSLIVYVAQQLHVRRFLLIKVLIKPRMSSDSENEDNIDIWSNLKTNRTFDGSA